MADYYADGGSETVQRRAEAAADPTRWRVGGSPGSGGRNVYQGAHQKGRMDDSRTAAYVVSVLNAYEAQGRQIAAGDLPTGAPTDCRKCGHLAVVHTTAYGCNQAGCECGLSYRGVIC